MIILVNTKINLETVETLQCDTYVDDVQYSGDTEKYLKGFKAEAKKKKKKRNVGFTWHKTSDIATSNPLKRFICRLEDRRYKQNCFFSEDIARSWQK